MGKDPCRACGGYSFSLNDGFMYCDRCGTLLENFEELEADDGVMGNIIGIARIKVKSKKEKQKNEGRKGDRFKSEASKMEEAVEKMSNFYWKQIPKPEHLPFDESPHYLYAVGLRLFAFTQVLAKSAHILVKEMDFTPKFIEKTLAVYQRYLEHCSVAFCPEELYNGFDEDRFIALLQNADYEKEQEKEKKAKKEARKSRGMRELSRNAAAWTMLTQGNMTEHLELDSSSEEEEEAVEEEATMMNEDATMGFVRRITTGLSKEAVRRASHIRLNLEILVSILHSASLCTGYRNLIISDFVRWVREDRFRISRKSINSFIRGGYEKINKALDQGESHTRFDTYETELKMPLYEIMRTSIIFNQSLQIEKSITTSSFAKVAARLLENLNLPTDFLRRTILIESIVKCDMSPILTKQYDIKNGFDFKKLTGFPPRFNQKEFMKSFGRKNTEKAYGAQEVILSSDTKMMAYILLVIKMTIDLDMNGTKEGTINSDNFDIDTWIHQLEMRVMCMQGHDMTMVLRNTCPVPSMSQEYPFGHHNRYKLHDDKVKMQRFRRQLGFRECIPSEMSFHSTSNVPTVFDIRGNNIDNNTPDAILFPLKFQKKLLKKEMEKQRERYEYITEDSRATFFKKFTNVDIPDSREKWNDVFPACKAYSVHAHPDWIADCTARRKKDTPLLGDFRVFLSVQLCQDLYECAKPTFSKRFDFLLTTFALLIGEDVKALYAAFAMLEMHLLDAETIRETKRKLIEQESIELNCRTFRKTLFHNQLKFGMTTSQAVERIEDIKYFELTAGQFNHPELSSDDECEFLQNNRCVTPRSKEKAKARYHIRLSYSYKDMFPVIAIKFW